MSRREPAQVQAQIGGLLPFVHTPFISLEEVDIPRFRRHLRWLEEDFAQQPSCYFICCGSGELWSVSADEHRALVRAAVEEVGQRAPVVAGVGYGTRLAMEQAISAQEAGADALLVFPPYLAAGPQEGLLAHYGAIAGATELAVLVYHRDNAVFAPETMARLVEAHPNVIGMKDGYGDLDLLAQVRDLLGDAFLLANGMPSAEMYAKAYTAAGIRSYSPGGIEFVPEIAWAFDAALERQDGAEIDRWVEGFYRPYTELRNQVPGYGISLLKAGLGLRGRPTGIVRPPLVEVSPEHRAQLATIIERGLAMLA